MSVNIWFICIDVRNFLETFVNACYKAPMTSQDVLDVRDGSYANKFINIILNSYVRIDDYVEQTCSIEIAFKANNPLYTVLHDMNS